MFQQCFCNIRVQYKPYKHIYGKSIEQANCFEYLGINLDESMSWKEHIENINEKLNKRLNMVFRIRPCLPAIRAAKCFFNTFVQPLLDYTDFSRVTAFTKS